MKKPRAIVLAVAVALVALLAWPAIAEAETAELVSVSSGEAQGNNASGSPSINADGTIVAFESQATNLVATDANGDWEDIFVRDLLAGTTELVSVSSDEVQGDFGSYNPSINADGTIVAFSSSVEVAEDYICEQIFVRYLLTGTTELVSVASDGESYGNSGSFNPSLSADGSSVAFTSTATNLVDGDEDEEGGFGLMPDVFVRYLLTGVTELVSVSGGGVGADNSNTDPSINADGSVVAFVSAPIPPIDTGDGVFHPVAGPDVFVRDMSTGTTELVSVSGGGVGADNSNAAPSINADGSIVAFVSGESTGPFFNGGAAFVPAAGPVVGPDVFVRDRSTGTTELISVSGGGVGADNVNLQPSINADGSIVAFVSFPDTEPVLNGGAALAAAAGPGVGPNVFVRDRRTGTTTLLSVGWDGSPSDGESWSPSINADGSRVAFASDATNLVPGDGNDWFDVFVATYVAPKLAGYPNRYEQTDPRIVYTGSWETGENKAHSGGSNYYSDDPQATITITFKGTRLDWIAALGPLMGKALISIDGGEPVLVDLFSATELFQQLVWSTGELEYGVHTITITFPEGSDYQEGKGINIDALDIWGVLLETTQT